MKKIYKIFVYAPMYNKVNLGNYHFRVIEKQQPEEGFETIELAEIHLGNLIGKGQWPWFDKTNSYVIFPIYSKI